jgi:hypothetical protein
MQSACLRKRLGASEDLLHVLSTQFNEMCAFLKRRPFPEYLLNKCECTINLWRVRNEKCHDFV